MRITIAILTSVILLSGCGQTSNPSKNDSSAESFVKKACDGTDKLTWQERANFIAKAHAINGKWERLSDAANAQAGAEAIGGDIKANPSNYLDAQGEVLSVNSKMQVMYAQFVAECSRVGN